MKLIVMYFIIFSIISSLVLYLLEGEFDPRMLLAGIPATFLFFYGIKKIKKKESTLP
ncbi:hypothetical protein SAMN04488524_1826 [Pedobacter africanus]|uniref:Uncharacterized protein n=1 Tax=Pedobacter africanus TaxID=151894 RepID=A0A1W2B266_9SPHI|nr:hypothetical protein SAMN04488524_1826 [Pedobacter africanus]